LRDVHFALFVNEWQKTPRENSEMIALIEQYGIYALAVNNEIEQLTNANVDQPVIP